MSNRVRRTGGCGWVRWSTMVLLLGIGGSRPAAGDEYLSGMVWEEPAVVRPGRDGGPPSDAVVLFDGKDLSAWENASRWRVEDGAMICGKGNIRTKQAFGDCQLHIEWSAPLPVTRQGQGRGNSGVFLMGIYEIQVLDSYDNQTYFDGQAGAIYKQTPPQVNAMRPPGKWNVFDILWTAPRFQEDGSLKSPAFITALHNGVVILNHFQLEGDTPFVRPPRYAPHAERLPIMLQHHGSPVRFRNIWVREIRPAPGQRVRAPYLRNARGEERPVP